MSADILDIIHKHKLTKVSARNRYADLVAARVSEKAVVTKGLLRSDTTTTDEDLVAANLSNTFYYLVDKYQGRTTARLPTVKACKRGTSYWHRVASICLDINVPSDVFLKAQFLYFRKNFGRIPEFSQLVTASAAARAVEYYKKLNNTKPQDYVSSGHAHTDMELSDKLKSADKRMRGICRAQGMTRYEVYKNLVVPGFLILPQEYVSADPEYKKAVDG